MAMGQDYEFRKAGLLLERCSFEPVAQIMILKDEAEFSVNSDLSLHLERHVTFKFFKEKIVDRQLAESIFYPTSHLDKYTKLCFQTIEFDPNSMNLLTHDFSSHITSTHIEQLAIKVPRGGLLEVSYSMNFRYDDKIPDWHFQSTYPTEASSIRIQTPEIVKLTETIKADSLPAVRDSSISFKSLHLSSTPDPIKVTEHYYRFNHLSSMGLEPFSEYLYSELARMHIEVISVTKDGHNYKDFATGRAQRIIDTLSGRNDFLLRLEPALDIQSDYDHRIRAISKPKEKLAKIYDLVRRHIVWDRVDSLSARPLSVVWKTKRGNSTEINLILVKLLQDYGFEAVPLIASTHSHGPIDRGEVSLGDFNRTLVYVQLEDRSRVLDASGRYYDYPMIPASILNTRALLISNTKDHWIDVYDSAGLYRNSVTLLGHLSGDSSFLTNVYVNSYGYAKPEHVEILEYDSLKGLRKYFENGNNKLRIKHFIAANEYIDTLPLAQEFDIRIPVNKHEDMRGVVTTWFSIPDTLFTITESRRCDINFGYRQRYDLVSEFTYPENYEISRIPENVQLTAVHGSVRFDREYHPGSTNFSLKQSLIIDKTYFSKSEAIELAKFLKKIYDLNKQEVILKKRH